jgi:predicted amidophosphoribosyltransferase
LRIRHTRSAPRVHEAKRENVRNAFRARSQRLRGRTVLLVDDIMTSCSTPGGGAS